MFHRHRFIDGNGEAMPTFKFAQNEYIPQNYRLDTQNDGVEHVDHIYSNSSLNWQLLLVSMLGFWGVFPFLCEF